MPACAISWSGGKDSMLASVCMRNAGASVPLLVTMFDDAGAGKSRALPIGLLQAQTRALGAELLAVSAAPQRYAEAFHAALLGVAQRGIEHVVFGDIDLQAHRDWLEPACARAGINAVFPPWGRARARVARLETSRPPLAPTTLAPCTPTLLGAV